MSKDELIRNCYEILINTQNSFIRDEFYKFELYQDIVLDNVSYDDIKNFTQRMVNKLDKYIKED